MAVELQKEEWDRVTENHRLHLEGVHGESE